MVPQIKTHSRKINRYKSTFCTTLPNSIFLTRKEAKVHFGFRFLFEYYTMFNHAYIFHHRGLRNGEKNLVAKYHSKVSAFTDPSSRCGITIVNEMEDITSLMADSTGMMKRNLFFQFSSNTALV